MITHVTSIGIIYPILDALDDIFTIGFDFDNTEELDRMAKEFSEICPVSSTVFDGVVMAIDGLVMATRKPYESEVDNTSTTVMSYRNRKGVFGIVILAGCDAKTKFLLFNTQNTG